MNGSSMMGRGLLLAAILVPSGMAWADPGPVTATGVPAQIIPTYPEPGAPTFVTPAGGSSFLGDTSSSSGSDGSNVWGTYSGDGGSAMDAMMATSYGDIASNASTQIGVNPEAMAGIGQTESGFQNVGTSEGTSSATGPWQITTGTWDDTVAKYNLPYTEADRTNPAAQAEVASYIVKDDATTVSNATGQPATVLQTYGAWVYGPTGGSAIAKADPSAQLSDLVSAQAVENNHMTGWTVAQFNSVFSAKLGSTASQPALNT